MVNLNLLRLAQLFVSLLTILSAIDSFAAEKRIRVTGFVVNEDGSVIRGARITESKSKKYSVSDARGQYVLRVKAKAIGRLKVSFKFLKIEDQLRIPVTGRRWIVVSESNSSVKVASRAPHAGGAPSTPTPSPKANNFDDNGNVTERGHATFGIPANLSANILDGSAVFRKYTCTGCHIEGGAGFDFPRLTSVFRIAPMNSFGVTQAEIADLVAYLNRGRP